MATTSAAGSAGQLAHSDAVNTLARSGYALSGALHLLIAAIAVQVAWLHSKSSADQSGALQTLAGNGFGRVVLWAAVAGFAALGVWQLMSGWSTSAGGDGSVWAKRVKAVAKGLVYLALGWTSLSFARGRPRSSRAQSADFTASLMAHPGGRVLVGAVGLVVVGVGGYHIVKGWKHDFVKDLRGDPGPLLIRTGVVGYIGKGTAVVLVGVLFLVAAVRNTPGKATGLDGALRALRQQPMGTVALTLVAVGIAAYGVYSVARAKYARL
jgi:hypothetical protein